MAALQMARTLVAALALGGLCGAAVGLGYASPEVGVTAAAVVGGGLALRLLQLKRQRRAAVSAPDARGGVRSVANAARK